MILISKTLTSIEYCDKVPIAKITKLKRTRNLTLRSIFHEYENILECDHLCFC